MDLSDAFQASVIREFGVDVTEEEEHELRTFLVDLLSSLSGGEIDPQGNVLELLVLSFVAGRAYQAQSADSNKVIEVPMSQTMALEFINFLMEREVSGV